MAALKFDVDVGWSWTVCAAGFIVSMLAGGISKTQGLFFLAYLELFEQGEEATAWVSFAFGISAAIVALFGGYVADAVDHNKKRIVLVVVFTFMTMVVALAGYMPNLPLTILIFAFLGLLLGVEDPISMSMVSIYFTKWRTLAFGLATMGVGSGGMVFPLIYNAAEETFGFRGTMLILAGVCLHATFIAAVTWPLPTTSKTVAPAFAHSNGLALDEGSAGTNSDVQDGSTPDFAIIEVGNEDSVSHKEKPKAMGIVPTSPHTANDPKDTKLKHKCRKCCGIIENYRKFMSNSRVPLLMLSCELGAFAYMGGYFLIPLLAKEFELTNADVSYIFTVGSVLDMAVKIPIGLLVDKVGISKGTILVVSSGVYGVGVMVLSFISNPYVLYGHALLIGGFGGNVLQLLIPLFVDAVDESQRGTASAMLTVLAGTASALTPIILGAVKTSYGSYVPSLRTCSVAALLAGVFYCGNIIIPAVKKGVSSRSDISTQVGNTSN